MIRKMLTYPPEKRISAKEAYNHPWIQKSLPSVVTPEATKDLLVSLKSFQATQKLQQASMMYIATQLISKREREELQKVFTSLDKNADGKLSSEELLSGYEKMYGSHEEAVREVKAIMEQVDVDHSGYIDYSGLTIFWAFLIIRN